MKIRTFMNMNDSVFRVTVNTEDWSEADISLMEQYGEPEINIGGEIRYVYNDEPRSKEFGDIYHRVRNSSPFSRGFDSRDYESIAEAKAAGMAWKDLMAYRIEYVVNKLRENKAQLPTEEISEI